MTDTTNTPKQRIWDSLTHCAGGQIICYAEKYNDDEIEYIHVDLADAIVQAALERAAKIAQEKHNAAMKWAEVYVPTHKGPTDSILIADEIRALASDPAERAAIIKKAEEDWG